jgi:hypothetical protein
LFFFKDCRLDNTATSFTEIKNIVTVIDCYDKDFIHNGSLLTNGPVWKAEKCSCWIRCADHMSTQYRLVQSGKTASGGFSAGQG